jgi:beta-lactamase class D
MWFTSSSGRIEIEMTLEQARSASHQGQCDADVAFLSTFPKIARQLAKIDAETLRKEHKEYGAWDADELADHDQNLRRILWLAAGDIVDEHFSRRGQ